MIRMSLLLLILLFASGCAETNNESQSLSDFYSGDILFVDYLEITNGSTEDKRAYHDVKQIQDWLTSIQDISFIPASDQSKRDGFRYSVALFEGDQQKLSFTTNSVGHKYFVTDPRLVEAINVLFEK
ncbi:hypothetical protein [Bacillus sp. FJAT-28004]|uniref:hypothetical protein n=1 Tax=Bacillus sp. FJAT-28004 TaxID=1679165 RepID=UPI0006B63D4D|nr:hypothetical protein [Bacillus sp. FJAT-28004]